MNDKEDQYTITIGSGSSMEDYSVYSSDDITIDLSNYGAAQSYNYVTTNGASPSINIDWDSFGSVKPGISVQDPDSNNMIDLVATLKSLSRGLHLPMIYEHKFENAVLQDIHDQWVKAADEGDREACKTLSSQFEVLRDLTKNDR